MKMKFQLNMTKSIKRRTSFVQSKMNQQLMKLNNNKKLNKSGNPLKINEILKRSPLILWEICNKISNKIQVLVDILINK